MAYNFLPEANGGKVAGNKKSSYNAGKAALVAFGIWREGCWWQASARLQYNGRTSVGPSVQAKGMATCWHIRLAGKKKSKQNNSNGKVYTGRARHQAIRQGVKVVRGRHAGR